MKKLLFLAMLCWLGLRPAAMGQLKYPDTLSMTPWTDVMVNVGSYALHVRSIQGSSMPILFEAGGGDDASVYTDLMQMVHQATGATVIAYDRAGFGKSGIDSLRPGVAAGVNDLERMLGSLHFDGRMMLVAHSFGAFYSMLYAMRHPDRVKGVVFFDASTPCSYRAGISGNKANLYDTAIGGYSLPEGVALLDVVAENPPFQGVADREQWRACHAELLAAGGFRRDGAGLPLRRGVTAFGCGHYIYRDNPLLAVNAIVEEYAMIGEMDLRPLPF